MPVKRIIAGLDLSLTCPAIVVYHDKTKAWNPKNCCAYFYHKQKKYAGKRVAGIKIVGRSQIAWNNQIERYDLLVRWIVDVLSGMQIDVFVIEGYSYMSMGRQYDKAEMTGLVKHALLYKVGVRHIQEMPPTTLKKYATGKGNATKNQMNDAYFSEFGIDLKQEYRQTVSNDSPSGDIIDAYYLCKKLYHE